MEKENIKKQEQKITVDINKDIEKKEIQEIKEANELNKNKSNKDNYKIRRNIVILFIVLFSLAVTILLRASYLEYLELGKKYLEVFKTNLIYQVSFISINFVFIYFIIYTTNRTIKKSLKPFFEKDKKEMPRILNKSIALIIATIVSIVASNLLLEQIMLALNSASFGIADPIFKLDLSYYVFQKPIIEAFVIYYIFLVVGISIYMGVYHIIVFNKYLDGVDSTMIRESLLIKKILRNIIFVVIGISVMTLLNTQNMLYGKIIDVGDDLELVGAGLTEATVQLWGYIIFSVVILIFTIRAVKAFKKQNTVSVIKNLAIIPGYLVCLVGIMIVFDLIYVNSNELDKQKQYIQENINNTKSAYNINVEEVNVEYSGTINNEDIIENKNIINNTPVISEEMVSKTLENTQTVTGQFTYNEPNLAKYNINNDEQLVYVIPREIANTDRTYNNKTYEYTHGMGEVVVSPSQVDDMGNIQYLQKDISGADKKIDILEDRIYYGMQTNEIVITNTEKNQEYDYTDEKGDDHMSSYKGKSGLELNFLDRLILGISKGNFDLAFSTEINNTSKILLNTQVLERAKKALPYLMYDENPYTVITDDGRIMWVIDAYTVSSKYPYSQYSKIEHNNMTHNINYIRNSVKVIIDAYDGTMSYYITDKTDPIAMSYRKIYSGLFMNLDKKIPESISKHFVYPEFLYNVQGRFLEVYHNVKPDVLYREDDIWDIARNNTTVLNNSSGIDMHAYYTMIKEENAEKLGLLQIYTPKEKQNIISYVIGTSGSDINKLKLYKYTEDSNVVGPIQLDKQVQEDEKILSELEPLNVTGTKLTKSTIIVPVNNTLLYVEPIYQTNLNESSNPVAILKKVIVSSGNKVAIGDNLKEALTNLLAVKKENIEIENTDDIGGLIKEIIKANNNLEESNNNNDWTMIGKDIEKLQELIDSLEILQSEQLKKEQELKNKSPNNINEQENIIDNNPQIENNIE